MQSQPSMPGNVFLWRYLENQRNYPGFHLSADDRGADAFIGWLRKNCGNKKYSLQSVTPSVLSVPNNRNADHVDYASFTVSLKKDVGDGWLVFSENGRELKLECSSDVVQKIISGIEDIKRGIGDYSIHGRNGEAVWFWWYLK